MERNGILVNKIIKIPIIIRKHPSKKKGDSIFIVKYTIQDEVVNGNVPITCHLNFTAKDTVEKGHIEHVEVLLEIKYQNLKSKILESVGRLVG